MMGYTKESVVTFHAAHSVTDPNDSTTYYFGLVSGSALTTANQYQIPIGVQGVIRRCDLYVRVGTNGTAETSTLSIRVNDATDYTVTSTLTFDSSPQTISCINLAIPVVPGDTIGFKLVTPAWASNPLQIRTTVGITIEVA